MQILENDEKLAASHKSHNIFKTKTRGKFLMSVISGRLANAMRPDEDCKETENVENLLQQLYNMAAMQCCSQHLTAAKQHSQFFVVDG